MINKKLHLVRIGNKNFNALQLTDHIEDISVGSSIYKSGYILTIKTASNSNRRAICLIEMRLECMRELEVQKKESAFQLQLAEFDESNKITRIIKTNNGYVKYMDQLHDRCIIYVYSLLDILHKPISKPYTERCQAVFCDSKCGLNVEDFTYENTIAEVCSNGEFILKNEIDKNNLRFGVLVFTSGKNNGCSIDIISVSESTRRIVVSPPPPYIPSVGDEISLIAGCDKTLKTCMNKYKNSRNFRGIANPRYK